MLLDVIITRAAIGTELTVRAGFVWILLNLKVKLCSHQHASSENHWCM